MKKLSQAEEKKLIICRERAFDLLKRIEDLTEVLEKKEWPDHNSLVIEHNQVLAIHENLEAIEKKQFLLKYGPMV